MTATDPITLASREEREFPVWAAAQIACLETHGKRRTVKHGEFLIEAGAQHYPLLVVLSGELESCATRVRARSSRRHIDKVNV